MPSLSDAIAAPPPRPVRSPEAPVAPAGDDREGSGKPFADLLDDAVDQDTAEREDDSKAKKGGAPANADSALAAVIPWLTGPQPSPPPPPGTATEGALTAAQAPGPTPPTGETALPGGAAAALPVPDLTGPLESAQAGPKLAAAVAPKDAGAATAPVPTPQAAAEANPDAPLTALPTANPATGNTAEAATVLPQPAVPQDGRAKSADKPAEKAAPNPATTDSAAQTDRTAAQPPTNLIGNGGSNGAGNGAGQGGQQRPAPAAEAIPAAAATAPAGEADPLSPLQTLSTLPAHAAAHYAARPADDGAGRLPAAQLANPLVRVVENGGGEFRIDLMPDDLGPVRVVAEVHGGRVALTIQAEHADTLSLLRRDIHHLERALSDAGFELDGGNLQFSLRGDDQPRGFASFGQGSGDQGTGANRMARQEEAAQASAPPERAAVPIDGLVDITV